MKEKSSKKDLEKEKFLSMVAWTTDMLEDPNQFYKDMIALSSAVKG